MTMQANHDTDGRAYGHIAGKPDEDLVRCGPGTKGGELLRRYWQPIAMAEDATSRPKLIKALGEELVLFRSAEGEVGLLYPRCAHRGTSLLYGKVEEKGIRCCYHGWLFSPCGTCLETPCEPSSDTKNRVRQPWYPVVEKFGMVFAYMGPPAEQPEFPTISLELDMQEGEYLVAKENTSGPNGPHPKIAASNDYNWFQLFDNFADPFHVAITHYAINGMQFTESFGIMPEVETKYTDDGVVNRSLRRLPDGRLHQRIAQVIMPNLHCTPGVTDEDMSYSSIGWLVPADDTSYRHYVLYRMGPNNDAIANLELLGFLKDNWGPKHGRPFREWSLEDHQNWQTDYASQKGQGDITLHSEEHLTVPDTAIGMARRMFKKQGLAVASGKSPVGAGAGVKRLIEVKSGNAFLDPQTHKMIKGITPEWDSIG
ncbi:Rieske 2Fe-2S domain-containing protein [Ideonella azotifigens]|uniref:Aromatic ring-hydroxylating dioxygenase subunit alpha n=1 Tax=Ideonella azotifigens TaxID=513160 RepID=A0ABP3VP92_9BURK|nr:Rieske 2Fe-2S domain-containing protein [Ideonella azotifigens]MCD2344978.1 Rieske 2Fe-2S domain-containing protein [Ideonella azotifigens]